MRNNLPVTNNEYVLTDADSIVSKTDLKGTITFVNEDFKRISGFTEAELIGQPQNIVRHPDMPVEAFADFWATLKAGRPWSGMVKNRCKNGDFYWVLANATPIYEGGHLTGYMSVRGKPSRLQLEGADRAYQLFRDGHAGNLRIQDGKVVNAGLLSKLNPFKNLSIKARLIVILGLLSALLLGVGMIGLVGMSRSNVAINSLYSDRVVGLRELSKVNNGVLRNRNAVLNMVVTPSEENITLLLDRVEKELLRINEAWDVYMTTYSEPDELALSAKLIEVRKE